MRVLNIPRFGLLLVAALGFTAGCASPPPPPPGDPVPDPVLVQLTSSAQAAFAVGAYERAARFYTLALARARAADVGVEVGKQAYNAAACLLLAGRAAEAQPLLDEADGEFGRARQERGPIFLLQARAARQLGQTNVAYEAISRTVGIARDRAVQAQGWLLFGQMKCDEGDLAEAQKALARARRLLDDDPALRAGVAGLAGRLAAQEGRAADAVLEFDRETTFMRMAGRYRDMAQALQRGAAAAAQAGDAAGAAQRYYRAARSLHGQGDAVAALRALEQALAAAGPEGSGPTEGEMAALFAEIRRSVGVAGHAAPVE